MNEWVVEDLAEYESFEVTDEKLFQKSMNEITRKLKQVTLCISTVSLCQLVLFNRLKTETRHGARLDRWRNCASTQTAFALAHIGLMQGQVALYMLISAVA